MTSTIYNRLMIGASLAAIALPAHARDSAEDIIVTAQKQNQTAVLRGGSVGVFGEHRRIDRAHFRRHDPAGDDREGAAELLELLGVESERLVRRHAEFLRQGAAFGLEDAGPAFGAGAGG